MTNRFWDTRAPAGAAAAKGGRTRRSGGVLDAQPAPGELLSLPPLATCVVLRASAVCDDG
ncbi:hypothetical protein WMF37_42315 [Sorangium sp. So ce291]|uniref:hypothetical protein n=1 Tax=Sorangium sp. So ce291 TaxID=3133294 RepID=UPI003F614272